MAAIVIPPKTEPAAGSEAEGGMEVPMSLQLKTWGVVNPQSSSPLYSGRLPAEIRTLIFQLAFTESTKPQSAGAKHDFCIRYDHYVSEVDSDDDDDDGSSSEEAVDTPDCNSYGDIYSSFNSQNSVDAVNLKEYEQTDYQAIAVTEPGNKEENSGNKASDIASYTINNDGETEGEDRTETSSESDMDIGDEGLDWIRPDFQGPRMIYTALLRTCRRIYLETRHLPSKSGLTFWLDPEPSAHDDLDIIDEYVGEQLPLNAVLGVRSLHLHTPLYWLEGKFRPRIETSARQRYIRPSDIRLLDRIEDLRLTIRKRDWHNEFNTPLHINPFGKKLWTYEDIQATLEAGVTQDSEDYSWSMALLCMPRLKKLVIDFESSEDRLAEMETIVKWAKTWRFPVLRNWTLPTFTHIRAKVCPETLRGVHHAYLSAADSPVRKMSWRGYPYHWDTHCPKCSRRDFQSRNCATCRKTTRLMKEHQGPRLFVWTLTWVAEAEYEPGQGSSEVAGMAIHETSWGRKMRPRFDLEHPEDYRTSSVYF